MWVTKGNEQSVRMDEDWQGFDGLLNFGTLYSTYTSLISGATVNSTLILRGQPKCQERHLSNMIHRAKSGKSFRIYWAHRMTAIINL